MFSDVTNGHSGMKKQVHKFHYDFKNYVDVRSRMIAYLPNE